ncbi:hypothetical protein [Streptosporangium sp. NPDC087985]|uniref:hypothetical protein n=1 Tax=Streptosporangium sp. NPDC087985 TaxID=3366196 RepID=UPI003811710D
MHSRSSPLVTTGQMLPVEPFAARQARELVSVLIRDHGVVAEVQPFSSAGEVLISVWVGLVVRTDGHRFRWIVPGVVRGRGRPLWTWAVEPERAAARLAVLYGELRTRPVVNTVLRGPLSADDLLAYAAWGRHASPR